MTKSRGARRAAAIITVSAVGGLATWAGMAGANTKPKPPVINVVSRDVVVVDDPIHINMSRGSEVTTTHLSVDVGAHTAWHYHPGPHVVAVTAGTVTVYETDCSVRGAFAKGQGFFDPGSDQPRGVHTLYNPGPDVAHVLITDVRERGQQLTVPAVPQPTSVCF